MIPVKMTLKDAVHMMTAGKRLHIKIHLNYGVVSRHYLYVYDGRIYDRSGVDDSLSKYTVAQYEASFYGKAWKMKAVVVEDVE